MTTELRYPISGNSYTRKNGSSYHAIDHPGSDQDWGEITHTFILNSAIILCKDRVNGDIVCKDCLLNPVCKNPCNKLMDL